MLPTPMHRVRAFVRLLLLLPAVAAVPCYAAATPVPPFAGKPPGKTPEGPQTAVLAGGCFWGVDAVFKHVRGVSNVLSGYAGGGAATAHYDEVGTGTTGHAESVRITYDPLRVTYAQLLQIFFAVAHDPTELNRQGPDEGSQYRSAIFYASPEQQQTALAYIEQLNREKAFPAPIVTQVVPLKGFYEAEAYHQNFLARHPDYPYIVYYDLPKLKALQEEFPAFYRP